MIHYSVAEKDVSRHVRPHFVSLLVVKYGEVIIFFLFFFGSPRTNRTTSLKPSQLTITACLLGSTHHALRHSCGSQERSGINAAEEVQKKGACPTCWTNMDQINVVFLFLKISPEIHG